jgi:hypothetical protein
MRSQSRQSAMLFLKSSELGIPQPLTCRRVCPPPRFWERGTLAGERGVERVPILTRGHTLWYSLYIRLCGWGALTYSKDDIWNLPWLTCLSTQAERRRDWPGWRRTTIVVLYWLSHLHIKEKIDGGFNFYNINNYDKWGYLSSLIKVHRLARYLWRRDYIGQ